MEQAEFDRVAVFLYSDEGTGAADLDEKVGGTLMDERRSTFSLFESIAAAKGRAKVGSISTCSSMGDPPKRRVSRRTP